MIDLGTGNNNKMYVSILLPAALLLTSLKPLSNWAMDNKQEVRESV
jgi:hypothetical protein